jgi:bla regulator protein BlaR1
MDIFAIYMHTFIDWLLRTTYQASLFICLVLLAQRILRNQLSVRARYIIWLVVVVRMFLPWAPESRLSVYNLLPQKSLQGYKTLIGHTAEGGPSHLKVRDKIDAAKVHDTAGTTSAIRTKLLKERGSSDYIIVCFFLLWLTGAGFLTVWILAGHIRILRAIRRTCPITDPEILEVLDKCRQQMGTRRSVRIIATDQVYSPALFGLVRPCLLLPERILTDMDRNELRYIFLHELAHLKRHDTFLGMIASILHVLHWFNPLIGYGFRRMRADQELACDSLALYRLNDNEIPAYGHTVLNLIEQVLRSRSRFALTGFLGNRARLTQRISMISRFTKERYRHTPLAILLVGMIGYIGLTNGRTLDRQTQARPEVVQPAVSNALPNGPVTARGYSNIQRIHIRHLKTGQYLLASGNSVVCDSEPGEAGLWEARFDGSLGFGGDVLIYSVSEDKYLKSDEQGNLMLSKTDQDPWAYWIVHTSPQGVQLISQEFKDGYLSLDDQGQVKAVVFGRDHIGQWDIVQLGRDKETKDNINK